MRLNGVDAELLDAAQVRAFVPTLDFENARFPINGGLLQRRGGTVRHDAVAWGYARAADRRGVDILQNCEVTGIRVEGGRVDRRRDHAAASSAPARSAWPAPATPRASRRWPGCGCRSRATCCKPSSPRASSRCSTRVVTFGAGHLYVSQSDKGGLVFGGDLDGYNSYAQRGNLPIVEDVAEALMALLPRVGPAAHAALLGRADGHVDGRLADHRPHRRSTGLYLNGGWCYGGFKATPASGWCFAHTIARDEPHALQRRLPPRPLRHRASDRREGRRRAARTSIERCASPAPIAASAATRSSPISATPRRTWPAARSRVADAAAAFDAYVYLRDNPAGPLDELWHHVGGCRAWLVVRRDVRTHAITRVGRRTRAARDDAASARRRPDRPLRARCASASTGAPMTGHPGDTLASALLANGVRLVGRSFKYHRPRGILSAGPEEPNALVELRDGARREPNTRATVAELYDGLARAPARTAGRRCASICGRRTAWPRRCCTPASTTRPSCGRPRSGSSVYEPLIRRAAGLGRAAERARPGPLRAQPTRIATCW